MAVIVVGCGKSKLPGVHPAGELYVGSLFKAASAYAQRSRCRWFILSAKYGLILPTKIIHSYDLKLGDLSPTQRDEWKLLVQNQWSELIGETHPVVMLVSRLYELAAVHQLPQWVVYPLRGYPMGARIKWLKESRRWCDE